MNKSIAVIYKSAYGTTRRYAQWIAEDLGTDLIERKDVKSSIFGKYDCVVYGGGLYAGGILGADLVAKNPCKNCVLKFTALSGRYYANFKSEDFEV